MRPVRAWRRATIAVVPQAAWHRGALRYRPGMDEVNGGPARTHATSSTGDEYVALRFRWRPIGEVRLDTAGKLVFPSARTEPGVYRLEVEGDRAAVYFGEASELRRRFGQYRNPGPSQQTNRRLNDLLGSVLSTRGRCRVSLVEVLSFEGGSRNVGLDLRLKAARVLVESVAIVLARNDGTRAVLNLDKGFDRSLGGD
jgi:hypothetical protein